MSPQKSPNNPISSIYSSLYSRWCTLTRLGRWSLQWIKQKVYPGWRLCQQTLLLYILDIIISQVLLSHYIKSLKLALDENVQVLSPADSRIDYEVKIIITNDAQNHNLDEGCNVFKEFLFLLFYLPNTFPGHGGTGSHGLLPNGVHSWFVRMHFITLWLLLLHTAFYWMVFINTCAGSNDRGQNSKSNI